MPTRTLQPAKPRRAFARLLSRFQSARGGNVAIMFALVLLPLIGVVGGAIDYGIALSNKSSLQDAMDAAALAGAQAANAYVAANGTSNLAITQAITVGNVAAQNVFNADIRVVGNEPIPVLKINTQFNLSSPTTVMSAQGTYKPFLLPIIGINTIPMAVSSTSTMSPANSYFQIIFLVDVSNSMGVGGTQAIINQMVATPGLAQQNSPTSFTACAFACHDPNNKESKNASDYCNLNAANPSSPNFAAATYACKTQGIYYCPPAAICASVPSSAMTDKRALARLWGYQLKIDFVNSAIGDFISQLTTYSNKYPGRYTVGIDTFGSNTDGLGSPFNVLLPPTTNMAVASSVAGTIDIEAAWTASSSSLGFTYTATGLTSALSNLTGIGDGSSPSKMKTFLVFLTDGVEDTPYHPVGLYGRGTDVGYGNNCLAIQAAGVSMFAIQANYYNTGDQSFYDLVAPLAPQVPAIQKNCSSNPNQSFSANDGNDIMAAVNSTFNTIINSSSLRITN